MQSIIQKNNLLSIALSTAVLFSCSNKVHTKKEPVNPEIKKEAVIVKPIRETVITAEEQKALTPDFVLQSLIDGNRRFLNNNVTARDHSKLVRAASNGQYPKSVILSCVDSRIPVEDVFDKGIGDIFVARVAGNFANEDILGSMEFACKIAGAKLILVMGHSNCGAIKAAIDDIKMGNITAMLSKIKPAVAMSQNFAGERTSKNYDFTDTVGQNNVLNTIETIKTNSPILKEMVEKGQIKIAGAYYNMKTGEVTFLN